MKHCVIIGISDSRKQWFPPDVLRKIKGGKVFSGGKRHREIMAPHLPQDALWIDVTVPLSAVFAQYALYDTIVIFASGDPLFFGLAATIERECPDCQIEVYPTFHSLQTLAHRIRLPYHDMHVVSLTGRSWDKLDEALIMGENLIGVLTDRTKTPSAIHQRMLRYGYDNYLMTVGENLGNEDRERVTAYTEGTAYDLPNCLILQKTAPHRRPFGLPEGDFHLLNGRAKMITKMPIRLLSLSLLDLHQKRSLWDIGFCTGSVSIEAKLQFPHLQVTAFERREEGRELMESNARKFGTPGITAVIGDFLTQPLSLFPPPDAVFIGGHGGHLREMVSLLSTVMLPDCCIVFNSVSDTSRQLLETAAAEAGMTIVASTLIAVDSNNPIRVMKAQWA